MKKSYKSILLLFLVMILAMSAVSAADADDTSDSAVQAVDEAAVDEVASADVDDVVSTDSAADVVADSGDGNNFTSLQTQINGITTNPTIHLSSDIERTDEDSSITIDKQTVIIMGDNHKIDASQKGGIFTVSPDCTLVLQDVTLINAKGNAIHNQGNLVLIGVTFEDNTASENGVIYNDNAYLDISGSSFINNDGGAIVSYGGTLSISGSTFSGNTADDGGAILVEDAILSISDSIFEDNKATYTGGALNIYNINQNTIAIDNCTFKRNDAIQGGAISTGVYGDEHEGALIINDCTFDANTVHTSSLAQSLGSAICVGNENNGDIFNLDITGSTFINHVTGFNGAVVVDQCNLKVDDCEFKDNSAGSGAALFAQKGTLTITDSNFTNNNAIFDAADPTHTGYAGAVYAENNAVLSIENCKFVGNNGTDGGAVRSNGKTTIKDSTFESNTATAGGAIATKGDVEITGTTFTGNKATVQGGAIYSTGTLNVYGSTFTANEITNGSTWKAEVTNGGAGIYTGEGSSLTVTKSNFTSNTGVAAYNVYTLGGGIFVNQAESVLIDTCKFDSNVVGQGGAVAFEDFSQTTDAITGCEFNNNKAWQGGAVNINTAVENLIISDSIFTGNQAIEPDLGDSSTMGGAIIIGTRSTVSTNVEINGCNFTGNDGGKFGGAVMIGGNSSATIDDCDFKENTATTLGGAICNDGKAIDNVITNSNFEKNNAGSMGGAVFLGTYAGTGISNSVFTENTATNHGNAVCTYAETELTNNTFSDETADVKARGTGEIITNWIVTVMDGKDYFVNFNQIKLYANVTDDNGNLIELTNAKFTFNGEDVIDATWNATSKLYEALYTPTTEGTYVVSLNVEGDHVDITTATIRFSRSLSDLANKIASADAGDIIELDANYAYIEEFDSAYVNGIVIDKALTINGNGHTISGSNAARIFKVNAATTINNTKLVNGSTAASGGAIWSTADLTIDNCVFDGNNITTRTTSERDGGAIYADEGSKLKVYNSNFTNNIQNYELYTNIQGGAIGAIGTEVTIDNCIFTGNNGYLGGAIMVWSANKDNVVVINNSKFEDNVGYQGGAVFAQSVASLTVDNSVFNNNEVKGKHPTKDTWSSAGAIWSQSSTNITNSNFTANKAEYNGGAVYIQPNIQNCNALIDNCRFINNTAGVWYGAVYYSGNGLLSVSNSYFENNDAPNAKAIGLLGGSLSLSKNTIVGDDAQILLRDEEGYYPSDVVSQINITVMDNKTHDFSFHAIKLYANITDDNGNIIKDTTFKFLVGTTPVDAKYNETTKLYEATFNPVVGEYVVSMTYTGTGTLNIKTAKISFARSLIDIQNMIDAASAGDTITLDGDYAYIEEFDKTIVNGIVVNKNITIDGKGKTISGSDLARLFNVTAPYTLTLTNVTLTKGNSTKGGAIYSEGNLVINSVDFTSNNVFNTFDDVSETGGSQGGAIYITGGSLQITDSNFIENIATPDNHGDGAAIYADASVLNVTGTTFKSNKGFLGGAVYIKGMTQNTIAFNNCTFDNNTALQGGAIFVEASTTLNINDTIFNENKAISDRYIGKYNDFGAGAAISAADGSNIMVNVTNSKFIKNTVTSNDKSGFGATITSTGSLYIENSLFDQNVAGKDTISVYYGTNSGTVTVINSNFTNNIANEGRAGAIYTNSAKELTVIGSKFENNNAATNGGAIYANGKATIINSTFSGNTAVNGSAIYANNDLTLENNTISKVSADIVLGANGKIISTVKVIILNGEVKTINTLEATLSAKVTDDNGNLINDTNFNFTINGNEVPAVYDNGLYKATYILPVAGIYPVNITYASDDELEVENATVKSIYGTFTQLQQLINNTAEDSTLVLPYNFTYNAEIDGDAFIAGVVIDKSMTVDGNGSTISGAIVARIFQLNANSINITNTTFINGHANASSIDFDGQGGAIYSNANNKDHIISDCKFYNNGAYTGGAIYLSGDNSQITACEFEYNYANASGGAVFINGLSDIIGDSTFNNNSANEFGGAVACSSNEQGAKISNSVFTGNIALNGGAVSMQNAAGKISGSNFTENLAENGGAIAVFKDATITESNFTNNTADNYGGAVYVNGSAKLYITQSVMKNNTATVGSSIYSNGTIGSTIVNATILENKTWNDTGLADFYVLNATLTDDMGNSIYDPNFRFTVDGTEIADEPLYDDETGLYTLGYVVEKVGLNVISTRYTADNLEVFTGALNIPIANVTEFTVTVANILDNEDAVVYITLIGANNTKLNETVRVIINNTEIPIVVVNGTGNQTIKNFTHGSYPVVAIFDSNKNYNTAINSTVFYVKATTTIVIEGPTENVTYGEAVTINITVTTSDNIPFDGLITLGYYEKTFDVIINDGKGSYTFDTYFLSKGEHEFIAVYDGNNDYNASESNRIKFNVTAKELTKDNVTVLQDGIAPENVTLTILSPVDGTYNVTVNGNTVQVEVKDCKGSAEIDAKYLNAGNNVANVTIDDENYALDMTVNITYRSNATFDVTFSGTYPNLEITIEGTNGTYTVYIDDTHKVNITVAEGKGTGSISDIAAGNYSVEVFYDINDEYYEGYKHYDDVIVAQATPNISVVAKEVTWPTAVNVTVTSDVSGTYTVKVGNKSREVTLEAGVAQNVTFEGLDANENGYAINVTYAETENYTAAVNDTEKVIVKKADAVFNATVTTPVAYPNDVIVTVNTTVAGKVTITIEGNPHVFYVEAGVTDLPISDLSVGTYSGITVHFEADNYNAADDDITFEVTKGTPEFNVTAVVAKDTYPGAVTIIVTSDINAKFNVTVGDETKEVEVTNGIGYETFTGVAADIDNATVTFIEDTHYKETSKVEKFTAIAKSAPEFSVTPVLIVDTYKGKVNITISGVDGTYSIQINDVGTNALPIRGEIIVSGGKGSKVFENLTAGDKEVTATIDESANYTAGEGSATFTVKKATIEIEPKATGEFIVDGKINVTFKLPTDIDGTVIVYVDGVADPQAPTSVEGVYTIEFDAFNAGSHTFVATLTGDSNYADAMGQTTFDVEKVNVTISIAPDNSVPNPESILIKVADNATGTILVEIPGYLTLQKYEIENGTYTLDLGPIPADDYEIFVTYMGDDKYNNASADATFTIVKLVSPEVIVNITDTAIVGEKDVVVNITVGDNFANPGNVTVYVDGIPVQTVAIDEYGNVIVTVPALENGTHTIGVKYNGNNYFNASDIVNKTVTVTQAASSVTIDPIDNVTYGNTVVIKYTIVNETDYVTIQVADETGKTYEITVEDGVITVEGIIPAGKYTVSIHNGESGFYTESEANATFYVTEGPKIDIKVAENTTAPTFNITLPEDATGYVLVDVDGKQYYAPLVNGSATIQTEPLAGGNHTVNVTYTGDSKYPGFSNSTNVTIDSNITADSAFDIPTSTETSSPTFSINLPSDATGYLLVDVDGKKYVAVVENGTASITVPGLSEGNHNVTVSYTGDGKYPALSKDATVNVHIPVYKITENKNINVLYSASASYKVLITKDGKAVGAGETVTIKYNGKTYNVKTDSKGYATLKLSTKVKVKSYTITATYQGVSVKNTVKVKHVIKASNKKVKKSRKVTKIKITLRKVNNKYLAKKTIKVKFKGKTYKVKTNKKGVATWKVKKSMVKKLKVGKKYKYRVTYGKDVLTKKLTIKR